MSTPAPPPPFEPAPQPLINRFFDALSGPHDAFLGGDAPPYFVLGVCGFGVAFTLSFALGLQLGVPLSLLVVLLILSLAIFVVAGLVRRRLTRGKNHVLWEDVLLVLAAGGILTHLTHQPVWRTLDVLAIGIGAFMVFGRLGCLIGGCCHGRPSRFGIAYRDPEAIAAPLLGVRLFPVQLAEAAWLAVITAAAAVIALWSAPGTAMGWWLVAYGTGRFLLEFVRGDLGRRRWGSLSEAQWWAIAVIAAHIGVEESRPPIDLPRLLLAGLSVLVLIAGYATRSRWLAIEPLLPEARVRGWLELFDALEREALEPSRRPSAPSGELHGVRFALTIDPLDGGAQLAAYSLAGVEAPLRARTAFALAGLIAQRLPRHQVLRAEPDDNGRFHFWALLPAPQAGGTNFETKCEMPLEYSRYRALAFARALRLAPAPDHDDRLVAAGGTASPDRGFLDAAPPENR